MKVYIGIDWSEKKHDICFMNEKGEVMLEKQIEHSLSGFIAFDQARRSLNVDVQDCYIGLETAHNSLVDYLWEQGYTQITVLPPQAVKSAQGRYRQSGAKDDRWDARLIADILRTDRHRFSLWKPDLALTRQIRAEVSFVVQLTKEQTRIGNRLRAVLLRYYPGVVETFGSMESPVFLAFLQAYPTAGEVQALDFEEFKAFLRSHHHTQLRTWPKLYASLHQDWPSPDPTVEAAYAPLAVSQAKILEQIVRSRIEALKRLDHLYQGHPDRVIYDSLPMAGVYLSTALLAKLGDDRQRFPTPAVLQAVAGTCPVTDRSGKHMHIFFRHACDHEFRQIVQQWAGLTLTSSPWAVAFYRSALARGLSHNDAIRRLANRWLEILWRIWMDAKPYDEKFHLAQHYLRTKSR